MGTAGLETTLPWIDEHAVEVAAERQRVWDALIGWVGRPPRPGSAQLAALLGCRERGMNGKAGEEGSTIVGFRVVRSAPPAELALAGRHRFSDYALTFSIDDVGGGRSRLSATTRAEFPGATGRVYRALVIGSRGHVLAVRSILAAVRERAERPGP
jgi:hypothetical protein